MKKCFLQVITNKWYVLWVVIVISASLLRFHNLENQAPFDWDQNRDYHKVSAIMGGKLTLLGPIAKGDTGFYLGPLYYYLLAPGYLITNGNPLSFPTTSIMLDLLFLTLLFFIAKKLKSPFIYTMIALIWALSNFTIKNSQISWNVSLLPLWSLLMYYFAISSSLSTLKLVLYGLVAGLSWHIHASLLPLGLILPIFFTNSPHKIIRRCLLLALGYLLALTPLLFFDLRHAFFNSRLLFDFVDNTHKLAAPSLPTLILDATTKLGKNTLGILTGQLTPSFFVGALVLLLATWSLFSKITTLIWSGIIILLNFIMVVMLKDLRFPEYYLAVGQLPFLVILFHFLKHRIILITLVATSLFLNIQTYDFTPTSYALTNKRLAVQAVANLQTPVDIRYELSPGREGGLAPLLKLNQVEVVESSPTKIIFTDQTDGPLLIGGELAVELGRFGGIRVGKYELYNR